MEDTNVAAPSGPAPSRSRRTRAEPTTTPSATSQTSVACSGVETPMPTHTGSEVAPVTRAATSRAESASTACSPVTPIRPTAYTKPRERRQTDSDPAGGGGRRHQQDGGHPGLVGRLGPRTQLLERQVGDDGPGHPRLGHQPGHPFVTGPVDEVVVGHDDQRDPHVDPAEIGQDPVGRGTPFEGPQRGFLDGGPVDHRVGEGDPHLDGVGPGPGQGLQGQQPLVVHTSRHIGDQQLVAGIPPGGQHLLEEARTVVGGIASGPIGRDGRAGAHRNRSIMAGAGRVLGRRPCRRDRTG